MKRGCGSTARVCLRVPDWDLGHQTRTHALSHFVRVSNTPLPPAPVSLGQSLGECGKHPTLSVSLVPSHLIRVLWFPSSSLPRWPHLHRPFLRPLFPTSLALSPPHSIVPTSLVFWSPPCFFPSSPRRPLPPPFVTSAIPSPLPFVVSSQCLLPSTSPLGIPSSCRPFPRLRRQSPSSPSSRSPRSFRCPSLFVFVVSLHRGLPSFSSSPPLVTLSPRSCPCSQIIMMHVNSNQVN